MLDLQRNDAATHGAHVYKNFDYVMVVCTENAYGILFHEIIDQHSQSCTWLNV